ncbi:unnamed protein product, partial [Nippostrongylus brasiliensis]|uniref:SLC12 domain-containing protein n=1 Tax=Nippostrongylus brasiliensis TaxID=27835 RepID=A0A0N4XC49_NIPBR
PTVTLADEHSKILLVIPECLTRLKHCHGSREVVLFYYRSFFDLSRKNTRLFADEVGRVVVVLPPREPEDPYSWIPFVGAVDLWLACGAHVWLVNGPRSAEDQSWDRMNQKARSHVLSYIDHHPQFLEQLHDKTPPEAGILSASMACLKVGLVRDPRKWWTAPQAVEFYNKLRVQLQDDLTLGEIRMPKSVKETPAGTPSGSQRLSLSGTPAVKDGRISKRHLKRVERRRQRSEQKKLEKQMEFVSLGI